MIALLCFVLAVLVSPFKSKSRLEAENAALRHQVVVLRRMVHRRCPAYEQRSLVLHPVVSMVSVRPEGHHGYPSRDARPLASGRLSSVLALEVALAWWAAGELLKLGFEVAQSSVAKYMVKRPGPPSQGWGTFLRLWINVTTHPTAEWIARQITAAFPWNDAPRYLIRDRDRVYGDIVTRRLRAMGIRDKPIAPASPWQNGFAERLIGSIRRECVDHFIVLGEAHLRRILRAYARYYNEIRTHRSLDKDLPASRSVQRTGNIKSHPILGGLHHHYVRI